jgi:CheY-like chemotaxis protein
MAAANKHILVVDDNQEILEMMSLMLGPYAYTVSTQRRVGDFIHEVKNIQPDLIMMDKHLGWADGCNLCTLIKSDDNLQRIPVIMFSAYYNGKQDCLFAGADAFFQKPFEMKELLQLIHAFTTPDALHR